MAVLVLLDTAGASVRDMVAAPIHHKDSEGGYVQVYDTTRWPFNAALNIIQGAET